MSLFEKLVYSNAFVTAQSERPSAAGMLVKHASKLGISVAATGVLYRICRRFTCHAGRTRTCQFSFAILCCVRCIVHDFSRRGTLYSLDGKTAAAQTYTNNGQAGEQLCIHPSDALLSL